MQRLGDKLHVLRERQGLTTRQLAHMLGVTSHSHVVLMEQGKRKPSLETLVKLMQIFNVSCDQLLNDELEV